MNLMTSIRKWLFGTLDHTGAATDVAFVARRVPQWGMMELPERRVDPASTGVFVGIGPTQ